MTTLKAPLIAAWTAVALAVILRIALDAGTLMIIITGVIALGVTAAAVARRRPDRHPAR